MQTNTIQLDNKKVSRFYQGIGLLFFSTLVIMGIYFYKEREFFLDKTYYNIRLITSGWFIIDHARYSNILEYFLPLVALKLGASLKTIMICDSIGLVLLDYVIFLFVTLKLKNYGAGLAILLVSCLTYSRIFYSTMVGINDMLVFGVLLWAILHPETLFTSDKQRKTGTIWGLIVTVILIFYHPLAIFVVLFVLGIEATAFKRYRDSQLWIIASVSIILFYLKFKILFVSSYEQDKIVPFSTIMHELPNFKNWTSTLYLVDFINNHFRTLKWLFILCVLFTLRKGILFFLFTVLFITGFTLIYLGSFYIGASALFSYETYFPIYGFFTALLFICSFYTSSRKHLLLLISLPLMWIGIKKMYYAHEQFTYRISYLSRIINDARKNGDKKCIIDAHCYPSTYADVDWAVSFETLLYSSINGPDSSVTVFIKEPSFDSTYRATRDNKDIFFGAFFYPFEFSSADMPSKYFNLPSTGYNELTSPQEDTSFHADFFSNKNIKIVPIEQTVNVFLNDYVTVLNLKIENSSGKVLPAIPRKKNPIELSYTLYDDKGKTVPFRAPTPFETDIKSETVCGLIIYLPFKKGTFFAKPDIITGDKNLWNVSSSLIRIVIN